MKQLMYSKTLLFLSVSNLCLAQIKIEIKNEDIEDVSVINVCLENEEVIKSVSFNHIGKILFIEAEGYDRIILSHVGYHDSILDIKNYTASYTISLRPKIIELNEVLIKIHQPLTYTEKRKSNKETLLFHLENNIRWYFNIELSHLEMTELYEVKIVLIFN
ncbi:MAG: hypothetical protein OHK0053_21200 [Microscillaceae bacterium]